MKKLMLAAMVSLACGMQAADVVAWKGAELSAWTNHISRFANPRMTAEGIALEAVDRDPQISVKIPAPFAGACNHYVEITVRSGLPGRHQLFWCSEKYGNFTAERHADFNVKRAGEWETHTVRPGWIGEGRITRLRIDPPDPLRGTFELKSVRVFAEGEAKGIDTRDRKSVV